MCEEEKELLLCEVKTAVWCWDWRDVLFVGCPQIVFPLLCVVAAGNRESVKNSSIVVIVEGIIPFAE